MMDIRKKALAVAVLAALAAPVSVSLDVVSPAIVSAAPAAETKASDAFTIDLTKGGQNDISIPSDGRMARCSMYSGIKRMLLSMMVRCSW